jgi:hypothetical protein
MERGRVRGALVVGRRPDEIHSREDQITEVVAAAAIVSPNRRRFAVPSACYSPAPLLASKISEKPFNIA